MTGRHRATRELARAFPVLPRLRHWPGLGYCDGVGGGAVVTPWVRHRVHQLQHPVLHGLVPLPEPSAAPGASVTAAPHASGVMHPVQHIYISERF